MKNFIEITTEKGNVIVAIDQIAKITKELPNVDNNDFKYTAVYLKDGSLIITENSMRTLEARIELAELDKTN